MKQTPDYDADDLAAIAHELTERWRLCDPLRLAHDLYALDRITAFTAALARKRAAIRPMQLPLPIGEAA